MAYDGNIGRILIKLEALTKEAEKELEAAARSGCLKSGKHVLLY